ncbi:MAG: DUF1016 N-terminal domain-containing protein, partial [Bacteroidaceae bacterium]|nr:DUF1016 N-terminal domain-containing protein [Bacteroidaceae bacterium]
MEHNITIIENRAEQLAVKIETLILEARQKVASVVNTAQVYTYFEIGRYIVEDEQGGKTRAEYGKGVLKRVSERLTKRFGKGWSVDTLEKSRRFFIVYSNSATVQRNLNESKISATVSRKSDATEMVTTGDKIRRFTLSWNHYQALCHVKGYNA